jgi:hypothetical protein
MKKLIGLLGILLMIVSCNLLFNKNIRQNYEDVNSLMRSDTGQFTFLKAHISNGDVYLFHKGWKISDDKSKINGNFVDHYNAKRVLVSSGFKEVAVADIILLETNLPATNLDAAYLLDLGVITIVDAIITTYCISNPKACFGSCPTFYFEEDEPLFSSRAEGFSSSVVPSLEKGDVDALDNALIRGRDFSLVMKNEALETHAVNKIELLAVPREAGTRVFHDARGDFYLCTPARPPVMASGPEGNILEALSVSDGQERYSLTDPNDLKTKETLELTFGTEMMTGPKGLVLSFRQTLLPTFLFYSALSYMGDEASDILAGVETNPFMRKEMENSFTLLGGIDVFAWNEKSSQWQKIQTLSEAGPIARNLQIVPLPGSFDGQHTLNIRLQMSKGLWRLDYCGVAGVIKTVVPYSLSVQDIDKNGERENTLLKNIQSDDQQYLLSLPGDRYKLHFVLPGENQDYELFLYSGGYYLEWIRKEWLPGKDVDRLRKMVRGDEKTWNELAREFKQMEPSMEAAFWGSRAQL